MPDPHGGESIFSGIKIGPPRGRRPIIVGAASGLLVIAGLITAAIVLGSSAGAAGPAKRSSVVSVQRRDLVATDTESGTLGYGDPQTVFNRLSGTITSLPAAGTVVKPGGTLYTVDNAPVVLMNGTLPAYRTLSAGVTDGPDVQELKANLSTLGFGPGTVNQTFDADTTAAVERWQASLGQTQTGTVTLGSVVFLPGPRRVSSVSATLGSAGGASSAASSGGATTASTVPASHAEFVDLTTPASSTTTSTTTSTTSTTSSRTDSAGAPQTGGGPNTATLQALVALLKAETAELRSELAAARSGASGSRGASSGGTSGSGSGGGGGSARSSSGGGSGGSSSGGSGGSGGAGGAGSSAAGSGSSSSGGASATAVLQTTSTELVATVPLDATKQSEAVEGQPVTVQMPDGSIVDGKISQVAAAAQTTSSSSSSGGSGSGSGGSSGGTGSGTASSTVPVTISLKGRHSTSGLDQAAVSVNFEQQKANGVLSVPVTALVATAGGGYAVQEAAAPGRLIPVTTGIFAAGYVQISGNGIDSGLQITDSQG